MKMEIIVNGIKVKIENDQYFFNMATRKKLAELARLCNGYRKIQKDTLDLSFTPKKMDLYGEAKGKYGGPYANKKFKELYEKYRDDFAANGDGGRPVAIDETILEFQYTVLKEICLFYRDNFLDEAKKFGLNVKLYG